MALVVGVALGQENVFSLTMQGSEAANPFTSDEDVEAGARVFRTSCALCHGGDATGGLGPDLTASEMTGTEIADLIRTGSDPMPFYQSDIFSNEEVAHIAAFTRSLQPAHDD